MKRQSSRVRENGGTKGGRSKKARQSTDDLFIVDKTGDRKVRARIEDAERKAQEEAAQRRTHDILARQVASAIPVVAGTELSTITVSTFRIIPLLPFAPPSTKVHTMLIRMRPNERLCFYGRVHVRVFQGCAQVFGHHYYPSAEYHTLFSPFITGALFIDAVTPTQAMLKTKEERDKLRSAHGRSTSTPPVATQLNPAYNVLDEDIYTALSQKRVQEDVEGNWNDEVVLVLRSFYEAPPRTQSRDLGEQEDGEGTTEPRAIAQQQPGLPVSPPLAVMHELPAHRLFITDSIETEQRRPFMLRIAPQPDEGSSSDSDESEDANKDTKEDKHIELGKQMEVVEDVSEPSKQTAEEVNTATTITAGVAADARVEDTNGGEPEEQLAVTEERDGDAIETEAIGAKDDGAQQAVSASTSTDTDLLPEETVNGLVSHYLRIPGFYAVFPHIKRTEEAMQIPRAWAPLLNSLMLSPVANATHDDARGSMDVEAQTAALRVVITGKKGMGKSTIAQYLLNSLLNKYPFVVYLDTDLGQPEFTPTGLVSLHVISSPVFGPAFSHLATPIKAYFMGDASLEEVLEPYSQAIRSLVDHYRTGTLPGTSVALSQLPLIVNTHGWLKGLGYEALRNAVNYIAPTVAVHLYPVTLEQTEKGPDFPFADEELEFRFERVHLLPAITQRRPRMPLGPEDLRRLRLDAYFDCWGEGSLVTQIPYRVPWNAIRLAFMDGGADVPPSECLLAFNASLVGLCVDTADYLPCAPPGQADLSRGQSIYPSFLLSAPRCECIGLGIVRTIDPVTHQFYVLTPVPPGQLQQVNTLIKGALILPAPTLQRGGWLSNPYLLTEAISRAGGAKMAGGRPNIQRKHLSK